MKDGNDFVRMSMSWRASWPRSPFKKNFCLFILFLCFSLPFACSIPLFFLIGISNLLANLLTCSTQFLLQGFTWWANKVWFDLFIIKGTSMFAIQLLIFTRHTFSTSYNQSTNEVWFWFLKFVCHHSKK